MREQPVVATWLMVFLFGLVPSRSPAEEPNVLSQYVLMAYSAKLDRTVPLVRVVLAQPAPACPAIVTSTAGSIAMAERANPNPSAFGVMVCEAVVELAAGVTATVAGQGKALPIPALGEMTIERLVVVGDSGCKAPKQDCATEWPFPAVSAAAASDDPDLVIHVGDYNYSGTPSKTEAGEWSYDGCVPEGFGPLVSQSTYDTWPTWHHDFFGAAAPLLARAPWVVVRGNHELCSRAGQGWFFFLDPHSPLLDPYRPQPACATPTVTSPPYRLHFANLDLLVLDTANACGGEDPENAAGIAYEVHGYKIQVAQLATLLGPDPQPAWLLGHRPVWSIEQYEGGQPTVENPTLQAAFGAVGGGWPAAVKMVLSGHMHQFFTLSFEDSSRPAQLVIGNSGVALESSILPSPYTQEVDGATATGLSIDHAKSYGYLLATVTDGGAWTGTVKAFDASGTPQSTAVATCALPMVDGKLCQVP